MSYNVICQRCTFQYKNHELFVEERTGLRVCEWCLDPRHPADYVKAKPDDVSVPYTRPDKTDVSVEVAINPITQTTVPSGTFNTNNNTL